MAIARPRILVAAERENPANEYCEALREAGADPVLVSPVVACPSQLDVDGLLLTGGGDVEPALYGDASPLAEDVDAERDALESALLRTARDHRVPTLCICRGLQIANVAFGGTLLPDLPDHFGAASTIRHSVRNPDGRTERGLIPEHVVAIERESLLRRIVGAEQIVTGSRHHQGVDRCAGDLRVVARTNDGIAEALEARFDSPFWLAVQWHPESTRELDAGASRALFSAFVQAAVTRCARPGGVSGGAIGGAPR
jgi:putative glutamine amidotransferase